MVNELRKVLIRTETSVNEEMGVEEGNCMTCQLGI